MKPTRLSIERLEDRTMPALIASQLPLATLPPLFTLQTSQVSSLLSRAAAATGSDDAIIAIVDRAGNLLGVRVEGGVSAAVTGNTNVMNFAIDGAISKARTAAFFSSNADPLTSRTVQFISQSTVTEREVNSYSFDSNPASTTGGPGFVAPIGIGGHFPPNIANNPQVDLFGIEHTNRDMFVNPGAQGILNTPLFNVVDNVTVENRFNIDGTFVPAGKALTAPLSYFDTLLQAATPGAGITANGQDDPTVRHVASRGVGTLPGGLPIYQNGVLLGGIGVFFPGTTGFASEENSQLSVNFNPALIDRSMEAEFIALSAIGGSSQAGIVVGTLGGIPALNGIDLPFPRIDLVGITLDTVGPGGLQGPTNLQRYATANFSIGTGNPNSGANRAVNFAGATLLTGSVAPDGDLVTPHDGVGITAAQAQQIIEQGIQEANKTRSALRPLSEKSRMVFSVADSTGEVVALYRMKDAPMFSINVAVGKARNVAYYDDPTQLQAIDQIAGVSAGTSFTARTFRFLALPRYPEGINTAPPGVWSSLNDPGVNRDTALNTGAAQAISAFTSTFGYDAFHPNTNFHQTTNTNNANGVIFFPGSSGVYAGGTIRGGFGSSGDGVDQDDVNTAGGIRGFVPASTLRVDNSFFRGVRLPYMKFNRNPRG